MRRAKFLTVAALLVLLLSSFFTGDMKKVSAEGEGARLEISSAEGYVGDTINVTVSLTENPGIAGMGVWVCYDKAALRVVDVVLSSDVFVEDLAECQKAGDGYVGYSAAGSRDNAKTGQLFTIQFEIIGGAAVGDSVLTYSGSNGAPEASNAEGNTVALNLSTGKVAIICRHENTTSSEVPATCTEAGSRTITCTDCGQVLKTETIAATGHTMGAYTVTKEATCTESGVETAVCTICGEEQTRETAALGHDWGEYEVVKAATCMEPGEETAKCSRCNESDTREIPATGHIYGEATVTKEETETEEGEITATCTVDGTEATWTIPAIQKDAFQASVLKGDGKVIENAEFVEGTKVAFTASVQGVNQETPVAGNVRYVPTGWKLGQKSGELAAANGLYSAEVLVDKAGNHKLEISYDRQFYNGTKWATYGVYTYTASFRVTEKKGETPSGGNIGKPSDTTGTGSSGTGENQANAPAAASTESTESQAAAPTVQSNETSTSPKTGETDGSRMATIVILLGLASLAIAIDVVKKKKVK